MRWIWFSIFAAVCFGLTVAALNKGWNEAAAVLGLVMTVFTVAALAEFWSHYGQIQSVMFERRQQAVNTTPLVLIANALRGLHPENVAVLNRFAVHTVWDVQVDLENGERDWLLRGTDVHFGFIEYVLDRSQGGKLYPRWKFSEGAKAWDPLGIVEDREQHRQFELWLSTRLVVVREYGQNHPAMFLPPWTPALLKERMGLAEMGDLYQPGEVAAQTTVKRLEDEQRVSESASQPKPLVEKPLTDDDMAKIHALETARVTTDVSEYLRLKKIEQQQKRR
jgi:hypothetical protein